MEYLRNHIEQIIAGCDIVFLQWLIASLPDTGVEIKAKLIAAMGSGIVCN